MARAVTCNNLLAIVGDDGVRVATQAVAGKHAPEHAGAHIALGIILMTLLWGEHLHVLVFEAYGA